MKITAKRITGCALTLVPLLFATYLLWQQRQAELLIITGGIVVAAMCRLLEVKTKLPQCLSPPKALWPGLSFGAAAVITLHQTSEYFNTGAAGHSMHELLLSYRMFGFHPNWRTVLFSTIMMVVLITWPRKFPKFSKTLPAGFVGCVVVTALNLLLNPVVVRSVVPELLPNWLPFFNRLPTSALAMLLIFAAWEHMPYGQIKGLLKARKPAQLLLFAALIGVTFWFGVLWGMAGSMIVWSLCCYHKHLKKLRQQVDQLEK